MTEVDFEIRCLRFAYVGICKLYERFYFERKEFIPEVLRSYLRKMKGRILEVLEEILESRDNVLFKISVLCMLQRPFQ